MPAETAGATEPLCFCEVGFATPQLLGKALLLGHIDSRANDAFQTSIFADGNADATNVPELAVGPDDAFLNVATGVFRQPFLDRSSHEFAVLWVDCPQVFRECGRPLVGVKSVDLEQLRRPIVIKSGRIKCPASHVGKSFAFA